jgi:hypothetical protein
MCHYDAHSFVRFFSQRSDDHIRASSAWQVPRIDEDTFRIGTSVLYISTPQVAEGAVYHRVLPKYHFFRVTAVTVGPSYDIVSILCEVLRHYWDSFVENRPPLEIGRGESCPTDVIEIILGQQDNNGKLISSQPLIFEVRNNFLNDKGIKMVRQLSD